MKMVDVVIPIQEFVKLVMTEMIEFCFNVQRLGEQYRQILCLKENLSDDEVVIQMDFAENYMCRSVYEI